MWMESHAALAHLDFMAQNASQRICSEPIGEAALNRGSIDLLVEATRLKFTEAEIIELKRLYAVKDQTSLGKTPQKTG